MKIRLMYLIPKIESLTGGTEQQLITLLNRIDKKKFDVILAVFRETDLDIRSHIRDVGLINLNIKKILSLKSIRTVRKEIKKHKINILHTFFIDGNILGVLSSILSTVDVVITSRRDLGYWYTNYYIFLFKFLNMMTDLIIVNSYSIKDITMIYEKAPERKIKVVHNMIDYDEITLKVKEAQSSVRLSVKKDYQFIVGTVANLRRVKRLDVFIEAAYHVLQSRRPVGFIIVGGGEEEEYLSDLAKKLKIEKHVHFLGKQRDVIPIIKEFDIAVNSSDSEGLSNAVIEYMACGKPVVATDNRGNSEVIINEQNGYLVPVGAAEEMAQKIIQLLNNQDKIKSIARNNVMFIKEKFSIGKIIDQYEKCYSEILGRLP